MCNDLETFIFFDSLNDFAGKDLTGVLKTFDYSKLIDFYSVRNVFQPVALTIIKDLNLKIMEETNGFCYSLPKDDAKLLEVK